MRVETHCETPTLSDSHGPVCGGLVPRSTPLRPWRESLLEDSASVETRRLRRFDALLRMPDTWKSKKNESTYHASAVLHTEGKVASTHPSCHPTST